MSDVKVFTPWDIDDLVGAAEGDDGQYVLYSEYQALEVRHDALLSNYDKLATTAHQLLSLVQQKGLPHTDPANQKLFKAGDVILVNEGNLWNLLMVLQSQSDRGAE